MRSDTPASSRPPRRGWVWLAVIVTVGVLAGSAGWATATVLRPAEDPLDATPYTFVSVEQGEVSSSVNLNAVAEWSPTPVGTNQASGIVTGVVVAPGDEVVQGSTLYLLNQRPVVVAQGAVPAFRPIGEGVEGADVAQLQAMLHAQGSYSGTIDGTAGPRTVTAIKAWQKALGVAQTGLVELGDVVFVPTLPIRVSLDAELVSRGLSLSGGEPVLRGLPAAPAFTMPVTDAQAAMMPTGTAVQVTSPEGTVWDAVAGDRVTDEQSQTIVVSLSGPEGQVLCGDQCAQVPVSGQALLPSKIISVATVQGLVVPSSALITEASGQIGVIDQDGTVHPVTVVASARGMSVIDGVDAGVKVRIPATQNPAP